MTLFEELMESMQNRGKRPVTEEDPKEIAKRMIAVMDKAKNAELTDDEISQIEAAAGYFDDDEDDYDSYPDNKIW